MDDKSGGKGAESRRRILDETLRLGAERGYHGTTVALVAERSGLPVSSIYWHFANKDVLMAEALSHGMDEWRAALPSPQDLPEGSLGDQVPQRFALGARLLAANRPYVRFGTLLLLESGLRGSTARRRYLETYHRLRTLLLAWWRAVLPGRLAGDWADHFTDVHLAFMEGLQVGVIADRWDAERLVQLVAEGLVHRAEQVVSGVGR